MKKLLSLLSAGILTLTGVGSVVSCSQKKIITAQEELREELEQNTAILEKIKKETMATFQAYWDKNTNISVAENDSGFNKLLNKVEENSQSGHIKINTDELDNYDLLNDIYSRFKMLFDRTNQKLTRDYSNYFGNTEPLVMDETNPFFTGHFINFKEISDITKRKEDGIKAVNVVYSIKYNIGFKSNKFLVEMTGAMLITDKPDQMKEITKLVTEKVWVHLKSSLKPDNSVIFDEIVFLDKIIEPNDFYLQYRVNKKIELMINQNFKSATYVEDVHILQQSLVSYYRKWDENVPSVLSFQKTEGLLPDTFHVDELTQWYREILENNLKQRTDYPSLPRLNNEFHWATFNLKFKYIFISGLPLDGFDEKIHLKITNDYLDNILKLFATEVLEFYRTFQIESYKTKVIFSLPKDLYNKVLKNPKVINNPYPSYYIGREITAYFNEKIKKHQVFTLFFDLNLINLYSDVRRLDINKMIFSFNKNYNYNETVSITFGVGIRLSIFPAEQGSKNNIIEFKQAS